MARLLFEMQGIRRRSGRLASRVTFVVYSDSGGTVLADISATVGGSAIPGSTVTVADIPGLGPSALQFWGPPDDTDVLYLRCPSDASLGVQEIEADVTTGGGGGGAHPNLATHDALGLATDAELTGYTAQLDLFAPPSIHGLHSWFAADQITGLVDGAAVATWADASGNGHTATQATGANQPLYKTGIINGLPTALFDGSNDSLNTAVFADQAATTIFAVVKLTSTSGSRNIVDGLSPSHRHTLCIRSGAFVAYQGGAAVSAGAAADTNPHVVAGLFTGSTTSGSVTDGTAAATSDIGAVTLTQLYLGSGSSSERLAGHLAEVVVYDRVLTTAERQQVEWYLGTKYGVAAAAAAFTPGEEVGELVSVGARRATLRVADRGLWVSTGGSDSNDGLSGGGAKLTVQAALDGLDAAGGGTVNVLGGVHIQTAELVANVSANKPMRLVGQGHSLTGAGTSLEWPTDLGAGTFAIRPGTAGNNYAYLTLEQLRLLGPSNVVDYGEFPADMDGVQMARRVMVRDCTISGFRAGIKIVADHNRIERVTGGGNGYGVYWEDMTSLGDHWIYDSDFTAQGVASLAIGNTAAVLGATIHHGHLGFCPYSVLIEPGHNPATTALGSVVFSETSFEAAGNGHIISPDLTAKCEDLAFRSCGNWSLSDEHPISGEDAEAIIQVGALYQCQFYHTFPDRNGDRDPVTAAVVANTLQRNYFLQGAFKDTVDEWLAAGVPPFQAGLASGNRFIDGSHRGLITKAHVSSGGVTAEQVVTWAAHAQGDHVFPYAGAFAVNQDAQVCGVAYTSGPAASSSLQDCVIVVAEGTGVKVLTAAATPTAGAGLMSDPADRNKVAAMDGRLDLPYLGFASADQTGTVSGTDCKIDLFPVRSTAVRRKTVTGSRGGNAALADLLSELAALGLITDSSSA